MQISKRAWHYRITCCYFDRIKWGNYTLSLCPYFWMVVLSVVVTAALAAIGIAAAAVCIFILIFPVLSQTGVIPLDIGLTMLSTAGWTLTLWFIALPLASGYFEDTWLTTHHKIPNPELWPKSSKPKEPSLLAEWAKAKHRKVCPRIDVTE